MGQEIQRLTALAVTRASKPGLYADGAGLYLRVSRNGSKSWALRFTLRGKPREMGLGGLTKVTLADARKKAADARLLLSDGRDPLNLRREEDAKRVREEKLAAARGMTFDNAPKPTSPRMNRAGKTKNTSSSGATQLRPMSRPSSAKHQCRILI
jgi:Arm DNA-binding domain